MAGRSRVGRNRKSTNVWGMSPQDFRDHVTTDGSLLGVQAGGALAGRSVVQLDHDEEMGAVARGWMPSSRYSVPSRERKNFKKGKEKNDARLVSLVEFVGLVGCRVTVFCGLSVWRATEVSTGVLCVLTGTHPCRTSTQARWWRDQSARSYERQCWCWCCCTRGRALSWWFYREELSVIRNPPRTISRALSFDLGTTLTRPTALSLSSRQAHPPSACARDLGLLIPTFHSSQ